jgi:hypothetical protein
MVASRRLFRYLALALPLMLAVSMAKAAEGTSTMSVTAKPALTAGTTVNCVRTSMMMDTKLMGYKFTCDDGMTFSKGANEGQGSMPGAMPMMKKTETTERPSIVPKGPCSDIELKMRALKERGAKTGTTGGEFILEYNTLVSQMHDCREEHMSSSSTSSVSSDSTDATTQTDAMKSTSPRGGALMIENSCRRVQKGQGCTIMRCGGGREIASSITCVKRSSSSTSSAQ